MGGSKGRAWGVALCVCAIAGCDAFGTEIADGDIRVVPTDQRPVQQALVTPPAISGGTLAITPDGRVIVADSDRDVISVVDLSRREVVGRIALEQGDEPGRVIVDANQMAHVALRRSGELLTFDTRTATVTRRTPICGSPRGVAYDASTDRLHVACATGELVALSAARGTEAWRTRVDVDLRDVIVRDDHLVVTRFKSAEQLRVSKQGEMVSKRALTPVVNSMNRGAHPFDPSIAWRAVEGGNGDVVMLHQRAQRDEVVIDRQPEQSSGGGSSYGGGGGVFGPSCDSIVHSAVTVRDHNGVELTTNAIPDVVVAVDVAASSDWIAIAVAGGADADAPRPFMHFDDSGFGDGAAFSPGFSPFGNRNAGVVLVSRSTLQAVDPVGETDQFGCADTIGVPSQISPTTGLPVFEQVTAVQFTAQGDLVYLTREPSTLNVVTRASLVSAASFSPPSVSTRIELGGDSVADTGHDIFHRDSGGGIACASCHAESGEDGHAWEFSTLGLRRTQAINIGLEGTAPFHWDGDMSGLHQIMDTVFVGRMGGVRQSDDRLASLSEWVFEQTPIEPIRSSDDAAARRGHALFMAPEVGCASCHSGSKLTNNTSVDVGTAELGHRFQVPSLVGIAHRAPFMHTGCASTLRERFTNTECAGGDAHGTTSHLDNAQIDDLVAYLETL